jgi:hypothetical protein
MSIVTVHGPTMSGQINLPPTVNTATLATLKADPVSGDAGTGPPNNGAGANDAAYPANYRVRLADGSYATWNGTAWVAKTL